MCDVVRLWSNGSLNQASGAFFLLRSSIEVPNGLCPRSTNVQSRRGKERPRDTVNPDAWRAALRVFEHAYGRAPEQVDPVVGMPEDALAVQAMNWRELLVLAMRSSDDLPKSDPTFVAIDGAADTAPPRTRG